MAAQPPSRQRHRARPGSVDRPVNSRMYRGTWLLVGIPLLVAAFSVARPQPLLGPDLPPDFDGVAATQVAQNFANQFPDRSPGSEKAPEAASWVERQLAQYGFRTDLDRFHAKIPGRGSVQLENVLAFRQGRSNDVIAVIAHRDNTGAGPGANDNASGTAALLELASGLDPHEVSLASDCPSPSSSVSALLPMPSLSVSVVSEAFFGKASLESVTPSLSSSESVQSGL